MVVTLSIMDPFKGFKDLKGLKPTSAHPEPPVHTWLMSWAWCAFTGGPDFSFLVRLYWEAECCDDNDSCYLAGNTMYYTLVISHITVSTYLQKHLINRVGIKGPILTVFWQKFKQYLVRQDFGRWQWVILFAPEWEHLSLRGDPTFKKGTLFLCL